MQRAAGQIEPQMRPSLVALLNAAHAVEAGVLILHYYVDLATIMHIA